MSAGRFAAAALAMALAGCGARAVTPTPAPRAPRLVVLIVVDQLPSWSFAHKRGQLSGGIARLIETGVVYPEARYPYSATYTSVGHAALGTGAPPAETGILANAWWDRAAGRSVGSVEDAGAPLLRIGGGGETWGAPEDGVSAHRLRVDGVGDSLQRATGGSGRAVGVALKDRGAILAVGRAPTMAVWYDPGQGVVTTSRAFADAPPAWLEELARTHPVSARLGAEWAPRDAELYARVTGRPDDAPGETNVRRLGRAFPHRLADAFEPRVALLGTPLGNTIVLEAVLAAIDGEGLGADDTPDYLVVSFSGHDYTGHWWGQESWEALDALLQIDELVGVLLDALDARIGRGAYAVALTSDHGAARTPLPARLDSAEVERVAEEAARGVAGEGDWLATARDPAPVLSAAAAALPEAQRGALIDAMVAAIARLDGVGAARRTADLSGDCDARPADEALLCRSIDPERSGELFYVPRRGVVVQRAPFDATAHGSPSEEDRMVPLILVAPGLAPREVDEQVSMLRVAPTLARWLGVAPPSAAREAPLVP